jgi:uncharacterized protein DUF4145
MSSEEDREQPTRVFICPHCEQPAVGYVRGLAVRNGWDRDPPILDGPPEEYALLQCGTCDNISVQEREDSGENFDEDDNPLIVYPAPRRLSWEIPGSLRSEFDEARACFSVKAYKATVVMVRRVLEGACRENGIQESTLARSLGKLREDGLIDGMIAEWADALRVLGNEGAHFTGREVPRDDAEDSLAFAEALLDHIYVLRKRFDKFARRRAEKKHSE